MLLDFCLGNQEHTLFTEVQVSLVNRTNTVQATTTTSINDTATHTDTIIEI